MPELLHPGVFVQETPSAVRPIEGVGTSTAAFIGVTDKGPIPGTILPNGRLARPVLVTSMTDYTRQFGGFRRDSFLTYSARAFFENGGRKLYIVRIAAKTGDGSAGDAARAARGAIGPIKMLATSEGAWGNKITVQISDSSDGDKIHNFKLSVQNGDSTVESFDNITFQESPSTAPGAAQPAEYARAAINSRSEYIAIAEDFKARPDNGKVKLADGSDGQPPQEDDFLGAPAKDNTVTGTGLHALDKVNDIQLIAMPGQGSPRTVNACMAYCKNRPLQDCFFVGDMGTIASLDAARVEGAAPSVQKISDAVDFATAGFSGVKLDRASGDYGAVYFPWVLAADPIGTGRNPRILLPPSGYLAGIYARTDNSRGVFKAPAGVEAGLAGGLGVATDVSDVEQEALNPVGVNAIRSVPGSGLVVWGARTVSSDASWRYVPVRRMAIYLRTSIYYGIQWAVFEPNDEPLWASLRLNIRSFMLTQFRAGALQGSTPDDAFFVKCDASTTTQQDIDNGVVNILVGFAPLKPAEFVVLKLSQKVNQTAA